MPRLPPVKRPQGLAFAPPCAASTGACTTLMRLHATRSSSATICASPVIVPWPISVIGTWMVMLSSAPTMIQAVTL